MITLNNNLDGYFKVAENGGTLVIDTFYNPETNDIKNITVRDYDYSDCSRDIDELYNMPIDENVRVEYLHYKGIILVGDTIQVIKGRTIEHGFISKVIKKWEYLDKYGRWVADYILLEDGRKINVGNCQLYFD